MLFIYGHWSHLYIVRDGYRESCFLTTQEPSPFVNSILNFLWEAPSILSARGLGRGSISHPELQGRVPSAHPVPLVTGTVRARL